MGKALLAIMGTVGEGMVEKVVAETVATAVDVTVEMAVVTTMGGVVVVGVESIVDMVAVLVAELEIPSAGVSLEATQ